MHVIMTADDFGASGEINEAINRAFRFGLLTEASLMVNGAATEEAICFAKENPQFSIGLHLVLTDGRSTLPPKMIPHLVDDQGNFPASPELAGFKYFFSKPCHQELKHEIEAQFERFAAIGLKLSHVDGHQHLHIHPTIFPLILPIAEEFGARGIRIPRDDLAANLGYSRSGLD